jgi:hypothetical protein
MKSWLGIFLAFGFILTNASVPVVANGIAKFTQPQPDAPVLITNCLGGVQFSSNQWGTSSSTLMTGVDFKNISGKTAVAVLFRLQLSNAFGDVMDNRFGSATGQFAPAAQIDGNHWATNDIWAGLGTIRCSVNRVLFSDGSVWRESADDIASPAPEPSLSPMP